jgi:hypothetical protein
MKQDPTATLDLSSPYEVQLCSLNEFTQSFKEIAASLNIEIETHPSTAQITKLVAVSEGALIELNDSLLYCMHAVDQSASFGPEYESLITLMQDYSLTLLSTMRKPDTMLH